MSSSEDFSLAASRLGLLGLAPFVGLAVAAVFAPIEYRDIAAHGLLAYGATILAFLGGVYWGGALAKPTLPASERVWFICVGVVPQLLGWIALLVPAPWGHGLTAAGLLALVAIDRAAHRAGLAPEWFMRLRWKLSLAAAIAMIVGATRF
jgi:hypothetical protein